MKPEIRKSCPQPLCAAGVLPDEIRSSVLHLLAQVGDRLALYDTADANAVAEIVHQTRVDSKRLRALWQLIRPGLKRTDFRELERLSRGLARPLASSRDAQVMQETLTWVSRDLEAGVRARLQAGLSALLADEVETHVLSLPQVMVTLQQLETRVMAVALEGVRRRHLRRGLEKTCRKGESLATAALRHYSMEPLHGWRRWIKLLLFQSDWLLGESAPEWVPWLKVLGGDLGRLHDLDVLAARVQAARGDFWLADLEMLNQGISGSRRDTLAGVETLAAQLYARGGRKRARQLYRCWSNKPVKN